MKKSMKVIAISASALVFAGCSSVAGSELADLKVAVEEARNASVQANQNAQAAYQLAQQNAEKINRVFRHSQMK